MRRALSLAVLASAHTTSDKALRITELRSGYVRLVVTFVKMDKIHQQTKFSGVNKKLGTMAILNCAVAVKKATFGGASLV